MRTIKEVADELRGLDLDGVIALLRAKNIKGVRGRYNTCPIARFIAAETGESVMVGYATDSTGCCAFVYGATERLCYGAGAFANKFDTDREFCPDLVDA